MMLGPFPSPPPTMFLPPNPPNLLIVPPGNLLLCPSELLVSVLNFLSCPSDILRCKLVSRRFRQLIVDNAPSLARPLAELRIGQSEIEENDGSWGAKVQREGGREAKRPPPSLWHLELCSVTLCGPLSPVAIYRLTDQLRLGKQHRIRSVCVENINFEDVPSTQALFSQLVQQKCQRLHLRNCHFAPQFDGHPMVPEQHMARLDSMAQFQVELPGQDGEDANGISASSPVALFGQMILAKFAADLRHRMRAHSLPILWDSSVPVADRPHQRVSDQFLSSLGAFILNWQHHPGAPFFRLRLRHCPPHFPSLLADKCAQLGISHMHFVFPSWAHRTARIQGKHQKEKCVFELFSVRELPARPNPFCLVSQMDEYF